MNPDTLTIDAGRAAILYSALATAVVVTRARLDLKSAEPYRVAIEMQLSAYEGEKAALARSFPTLNGAVKA
jgi:hypothetical protein